MTSQQDSPAAARSVVVAAALQLFRDQGFEATSVDQIAREAKVSRSTIFRQFGGKEEVVFADHDVLLEDVRAFLDEGHADPWLAVTMASERVFDYFAANPELARLRYRVVRDIPALREREILTVFRYERIFAGYLRQALPSVDPVDAVSFAALIAAVHNHVLRRLLRGENVERSVLRAKLDQARSRFGLGDPSTTDKEVVVAVFPKNLPVAELTRQLRERLES